MVSSLCFLFCQDVTNPCSKLPSPWTTLFPLLSLPLHEGLYPLLRAHINSSFLSCFCELFLSQGQENWAIQMVSMWLSSWERGRLWRKLMRDEQRGKRAGRNCGLDDIMLPQAMPVAVSLNSLLGWAIWNCQWFSETTSYDSSKYISK